MMKSSRCGIPAPTSEGATTVVKETTGSRVHYVTERIGLQPNFLDGFNAKWGMLRGISPARAKVVAGVLAVLVFGLDYYHPGDINISIFYGCVIVALAWTRSGRWLWGGGVVLAVLAVAEMALGTEPAGHPNFNWIDWTNRFITASMLLVTTGFAHIGVRLSRHLEASEQLLAEVAARERAEEALRERDARIRRLVESNIIGIYFWNIGGLISDANDAFLQIVGHSRRDLASERVEWTALTPPEFRAADLRAIDELRQTGSFTPFEKAYIRPDGSRVPVLLGGTFFEGSHEEGVAFVLDLTERNRAQDMLRRVQADFAHAARISMLGELTASIAHELKQPLAAIGTSGEAGLRWLDRPVPGLAEVRETTMRMVANK
jgi:PAS domain S-box-containing protein